MQRSRHSLVHSLEARTVHVKLYPPPRSFAERREVLRVLERYGEVEVFKSLKYQRPSFPNAFRTVFETESAAQEAINNSPIRYRLITTPESSSTDPKNNTTIPEVPVTFQLECSPTQYPHDTMILKSPLAHGYEPIQPKLSAIAAALKEVVPESPFSAGLADWETNGLRRRSPMNVDLAVEEPWRLQKKKFEGNKIVLTNLMQMWQLGVEQRKGLHEADVKKGVK